MALFRSLARMDHEVRKIEHELAERQKRTLCEMDQRGIHEGLNRTE